MKSFNITYFHSDSVEIIHSKNSHFSYPEHNHCSVYTLVFVLQGNVILKRKNDVSLIEKNRFFVIPPYETHALISQGRYETLTLCIKKELVQTQGLANLAIKVNRLLYPLIIKGVLLPTIKSQVIGAINQMALLLNNSSISSRRNIKQIRDIIETSPENSFEIKQLAKLISMSKYHFIREFKQDVGLSPRKFQIQNRVRKAQRLLKGNISLTEVALVSGFYDQSHFIRHFKRIVGLAPGDYRNACMSVITD